MNRRVAIGSVLAGIVSGAGAGLLSAADPSPTSPIATLPTPLGIPLVPTASKGLLLAAILLVAYGLYVLTLAALTRHASKRRAHDARNVLRLAFGLAATVTALAALTQQWLGLLLSLGVVGFAITFALQQPLLSLIAWGYILLKRPYGVGDRVRIGDAKGDVIAVDFLVTTIWEINGELVTTNQPSGRVITVPNSLVLSSEVVNFGGGGSPSVWNEIPVQVAFETDLAFARELMREEATDYLGEEMARHVATYREALAETPVELEVADGPSVNVTQRESWVELRLRYLAHPRRGQRVKNELYERILDRFNEHPDRIAFPVSRNR
ncbi:mechanosensitive ion channel domain-containing protein [Halopenitus sp. POP-27]|uniref:mechanosensitive ion channel family protein n=1 Tax=Halopenitus sp. POP-27 TaxID=2994425 RepID=UPI00246845C6|nr:mechanosensitive ion channel domain-containing protein [Halopenitus sp. POP-27]